MMRDIHRRLANIFMDCFVANAPRKDGEGFPRKDEVRFPKMTKKVSKDKYLSPYFYSRVTFP